MELDPWESLDPVHPVVAMDAAIHTGVFFDVVLHPSHSSHALGYPLVTEAVECLADSFVSECPFESCDSFCLGMHFPFVGLAFYVQVVFVAIASECSSLYLRLTVYSVDIQPLSVSSGVACSTGGCSTNTRCVDILPTKC